MAGDVHTYTLTIKGLDLTKAVANRPLNNIRLEETDAESGYLRLSATACEIDLHQWFNEHDDSRALPNGALINFYQHW